MFPTHPFSTALVTDLTFIVSDEVLMHPLRCFGVLVKDLANRLKLARMDVVVKYRDESELLRLNATHRWSN
jgi:hypothetical protein